MYKMPKKVCTSSLCTVLQSEVISARTPTAQAEQRATEAETRVLVVRCEGVRGHSTAGETKEPRRYDRQLETVQVHVLGQRWCS